MVGLLVVLNLLVTVNTGQLMCSVYVFSPVTCMDYWCDGKVVIGTGNFNAASASWFKF